MKKQNWWQNAVIYELYVDKFAKDFKGLTSKLDDFVDLGVNCLWVLPHYKSPMIDGGYDVSDYFSIRSELGNIEDFQDFVSKAKKRNIKVLLDLVLNHTSSQHPWFIEARESKNNSKRDFYLWSKEGKGLEQVWNSFPNIKSSNWIYNPKTKDYYFARFYPEQPDLNWNNPEVFEEMMKVIDFWFNLGIDGFRLDAINTLIKRDNSESIGLPETHMIIKKIRKHIDSRYKDKILIAEATDSVEEVIKYFGKGDECHLAYNFPLAAQTLLKIKREENSTKGQDQNETANNYEDFQKQEKIPKECSWSIFLRNHDHIILHPLKDEEILELANWLDPNSTYSYKLGEMISMRLAEIFKGDKNQILKAFEIMFSQNGAPAIYYGDEIGMRNAQLSPKPKDTRRFVRQEFDWEEAEKQLKDPNSILNNVKSLIKKYKTKA